MMMVLNRETSRGGMTPGRILIDGRLICYTLEDEVREIEGQPVQAWKIHGATAIPAGLYQVTLEHSQRFGPETLTIRDVPGFVGIRMHAGNTAADTEGCPLLGMRLSEAGIVPGTSRPAVLLLKGLVREALSARESVWIDINNPVASA